MLRDNIGAKGFYITFYSDFEYFIEALLLKQTLNSLYECDDELTTLLSEI